MKKTKRVLAVIGLVVIVALLITLLVSAIISTPASAGLFKASLYLIVIVPIMLYAYYFIYKLIKGKKDDANHKD